MNLNINIYGKTIIKETKHEKYLMLLKLNLFKNISFKSIWHKCVDFEIFFLHQQVNNSPNKQTYSFFVNGYSIKFSPIFLNIFIYMRRPFCNFFRLLKWP